MNTASSRILDTMAGDTSILFFLTNEYQDKLQVNDITSELIDMAERYLTQYEGDFAFLLDIKKKMRRLGLSDGQVKGVLNCMIAQCRKEFADEQKAATIVAADPTPATTPADEIDDEEAAELRANSIQDETNYASDSRSNLSNGLYTVVLSGDDDYVTLRVSDPKFGDFEPGTKMVAYLSGPDNERNYTGFAFIKPGNKIAVWKRYQTNNNSRIVKALEYLVRSNDPAFYGLEYALRSGKCWRCGRTLTVPTSLNRGLGPDCAKAA